MKNNNSLNSIKGVAAILVILIHAPIPGWIGQLIIAIARSAVALFFMISGYYSFYDNSEINVKKKTVIKLANIIKITLIAYGFYFFWGIFVRLVGTGTNSVYSWFNELFHPYTLIRILIFHQDVVAGHLWFLNALILCYIVTYILEEKIYEKKTLYLAIILLVIHLVIMNIVAVILKIEIPMAYFRNGWFYGLPIYLLGIHLHKWCSSHDPFDDKLLIIASVICFFAIIIERYLIGYKQLYFANTIFLVGIYIYCQQNPDAIDNKVLEKLGTKYYTCIYISQWAIINIVGKVYKIFSVEPNGIMFSALSLIGTIVFSVLFCEFGICINKSKD